MEEEQNNENSQESQQNDGSDSDVGEVSAEASVGSPPVIDPSQVNASSADGMALGTESKTSTVLKDIVDMSDPMDLFDPSQDPDAGIPDGIQSFSNQDGTGNTTVTFKDGQKNGLSQVFENGRLVMEMNFLKDVLNGFFKYYFPNKTIQLLMQYKNGKLDGEFIQYHPNGAPQMKANYVEGVQDGIAQTFDPFNNLVQEMFYKNGFLEGPVNTYHDNELVARTYYKEGVEVIPGSPEGSYVA